MATLKYRKSRKNKKQLKKKKCTYKKRKTTRRKKGGAVESDPREAVESYDAKDLSNIKKRILDKEKYPIISRLNFLEEAASSKHSGCTREYYTRGFNIEKYKACEKKKVEDYCAILIELNDMIEEVEKDKQMTEEEKDQINDKFREYKGKLEEKIEKHAKYAGINSIDISFICGMVIPQQP